MIACQLWKRPISKRAACPSKNGIIIFFILHLLRGYGISLRYSKLLHLSVHSSSYNIYHFILYCENLCSLGEIKWELILEISFVCLSHWPLLRPVIAAAWEKCMPSGRVSCSYLCWSPVTCKRPIPCVAPPNYVKAQKCKIDTYKFNHLTDMQPLSHWSNRW